MTAPVFSTLGASTLARKWIFEVNTGTIGVPVWLPICGISTSAFVPDAPNMEDDSDMQSGGADSSTKTAGKASASMTVRRKVLASTGNTYDPGQEFLRSKAINTYGPANSVQLRISEFDPSGGPRVEAYVGLFAVGWEPQGGDNHATDTVNVTLDGQGKCAAITHPYPAVAAVPAITSIQPNSAIPAAGGSVIQINGSGFTGTLPTTGVKVGGTNSPSWDVVADNIIVAVVPAHAAGSASVTVQTAAGTSTGVNVTYV